MNVMARRVTKSQVLHRQKKIVKSGTFLEGGGGVAVKCLPNGDRILVDRRQEVVRLR